MSRTMTMSVAERRPAPTTRVAAPFSGRGQVATVPSLAACTIIATNYLAQARVLTRSFLRRHPEARMLVLVVDDPAGHFDPEGEPFTVIRLQELALDDAASLCFKYNLLELCTAVKPFLLEHVFACYGVDRLLYLDPDILVLDSLSPLYDALASHSIALIPHITDPIDDTLLPNEQTFLQCGAYNLGFLGLSASPTTRHMLAWWQKRCAELCVVRLDQGLFVDQKWVDLVPALFRDVAIVGDPGYNVAYWNMHARRVRRHGAHWVVNGERLRFFHFSGYDPEEPDSVSKHQTRFDLNGLSECRALFDEYRALLLEAGYERASRWKQPFATFDNGVRVSPVIRHLYLSLGPGRKAFGDPFATSGPGSFFAWLNRPAGGERAERPYVSNLLAHVPAFRPDVGERYVHRFGHQRDEYLEWVRAVGSWQLGLDGPLLACADELEGSFRARPAPSVRGVARALCGASCRICALLGLVDHYGHGARIRALAQRYFRRSAAAGVRPPAPAVAAPPESTGWHPGANGHGQSASDGAESPASPLRRRRSWRQRLAARLIKAGLRPCDRHHLLASLIADDTADGQPEPPRLRPATRALTVGGFGVNLAGYLTTESGVGEAARRVAGSLQAAGVSHTLLNFEASYGLRRGDRALAGFADSNPYGINLVHVNADQVPVFAGAQGPAFFRGRRNIGFWMWELPDFPSQWSDRFAWFDEIWTPSAFTSRAIARRSPVPVWTCPLPLSPPGPSSPEPDRRHFGLPRDRFLFLFMFDFASVFERKNPLAVVEAFRRAFRRDDRVLLVLKSTNGASDPRNAERLREACAEAPVVWLERYMSREEITALLQTADAYVSLHRSEGFGLTMAEAMSLGKPVIATGHSGNREFMTSRNSLLVSYRLVEVGPDAGPYPAGSAWADPDVGQAADLMRRLFEDPAAAREIGARARADVAAVLDPEAVGQAIRRRLCQGSALLAPVRQGRAAADRDWLGPRYPVAADRHDEDRLAITAPAGALD